MLVRIARPRWAWLGAVPVLLAALAAPVVLSAGAAPDSARRPPAPVGIVSAVGYEQAPILAAMRVTKTVRREGYTFYVGTIAGKPVVSVLGYEDDESAQLATYLLAKHFRPRALVFSGTAGSQSPHVNVGDVVLGGFVADKSNIHYLTGGSQTSNKGVQVRTGGRARIAGSVVGGYGHPVPTPTTASGFGYGPDGNNRRLPYVEAYAATRQLVTLGRRTPDLGRTSIADATGDESRQGDIANKVLTGVMGQAQTWTEPLSWVAAQNLLYQSDAEENESSGFAFSSATRGIPWVMVRGISDTPWHPNAYEGVLAAERAARVTIRIATQLPATVARAPVAFGDLSRASNARRAGYLIADEAFFTVSRVSKVSYTDRQGKQRNLSRAALRRLRARYRSGAAQLR
jgi:adenosylhomocysteine nucleosidase